MTTRTENSQHVAKLKVISPKVKVPAVTSGAVGSLLVLLGLFGIELPIDEAMILEAIGAVIVLVAFVKAIIGYFVSDPLRNG